MPLRPLQYNLGQIYTLPFHPKPNYQPTLPPKPQLQADEKPEMGKITQITSFSENASLLSRAESTGRPTIIYVSNSPLPQCKKLTPQYEQFVNNFHATHSSSIQQFTEANENGEVDGGIEFAQMEFSSETSSLFKFTANQLPVLVFMCRERGDDRKRGGGRTWCKTIMGADLEGLQEGVREMMRLWGN